MHVVVGPVPADSARAWLGYARRVLRDIEYGDLDHHLDQDMVMVFEDYLREWDRAARPATFHWQADIDPELVEYHMHAFRKVAEFLAARADETGGPVAPEDSQVFYRALIEGVLDALSLASPASAEFADHLHDFWPGLEDLERGSDPA